MIEKRIHMHTPTTKKTQNPHTAPTPQERNPPSPQPRPPSPPLKNQGDATGNDGMDYVRTFHDEKTIMLSRQEKTMVDEGWRQK